MDTIISGISQLLTSRGDDGSAFYVFDSEALEKNIADMLKAFRSRYRKFNIAYSYKTNYLKRICDIVKGMGCYAEVVSPSELFYAKNGILNRPDRIVYNGVIPDINRVYEAGAGAKVNVDNLGEFIRMEKFADLAGVKQECRIPVGVRLNFDIGTGVVSRFGVDVDGSEFPLIMRAICESRRFRFGGFQCHIGCGRPVKYWGRKAHEMAFLACKYDAEYIDLGGGMYGPMQESLAKQFDEYAESYDEYAEAVCGEIVRIFPDQDIELIVEPGTALVGNTMSVVAQVTDIKTVRGQSYITVNCCSNQLGVICDVKSIPAYVIPTGGDAVDVDNATIAGDTCLEFDYLKKGFTGRIAIGDKIVFSNVGAYSISASRQFIVPRLPVIDLKTGATLRAQESEEDMFGTYMDEGNGATMFG